MAVQRYRYQKTEPTVDENQLISESDSTTEIISATEADFIDIEIEETKLQDLDDAMATRGYIRSAGPGVTGSPGDDAEYVRRTGDTMSGTLNMDGNRITNLPNVPTALTDAVNANYVQNEINAQDPKNSARLCAAIDLVAGGWTTSGSGVGKTLTSPTTATSNNDFDGVTAVVGDRILVYKPFSGVNAVHNGVYDVTQLADGAAASTILTRSDDYDQDVDVTMGAFVFVTEGDTCAKIGFLLITNDPITVDTTELSIVQHVASDQITAEAGLVRNLSEIDVELDTGADAQGAGADGGSSGLEFDITGGSGKLRAKVDPAGGIQRSAAGLAVELDPAGAISVGAAGLAVAVDGTTVTIVGNQLVAPGATAPNMLFGAGKLSSSTTTRYLYPSYDDQLAQVDAVQYRVTRAGTLRNLRIRHNITAGNGNNIVYTVRINSVVTSIVATVPSTSNDGTDLVNTAAIAIGDLIDIEITKASSIASSPKDIVAVLEYAA